MMTTIMNSTTAKDTALLLNRALMALRLEAPEAVVNDLTNVIANHLNATVANALNSQNMALGPIVKERDELKAALEVVIKDLELRSEIKMGRAKGLVDIGDGAYRQAKRALKQVD